MQKKVKVLKSKIYECKVVLLVLFLYALAIVPGFAQDDFDSFLQNELAEFQNYSDQVTAEYDNYVAAEQAAFDEFRREVEELWGEFKGPSNKEWVEYNPDRTARTSVDFENGEVTVEVITDIETPARNNVVNQRIQNTIEELVKSSAKTKDYSGGQEKPKKILKETVLADQLETKSGDPVKKSNSVKFAREIIQDRKQTVTTIIGKDNKKRYKTTVTFALVPDHVKIRAKKFEKLVGKYSGKYKLHTPLVYAVIHTESYFNPAARSHVPAFGLMQLVPRFGARDAYNFVYKRDKLVTDNYLFEPENNIELGTAYIYIISNRYLKDIKDLESRRYCTIAAYNTGVGNVCRTFTGGIKISPAVKKINSLSSQKVYQQLRNKLPYDETKKYIENVSKRIEIYN